MPTTVDTRTCAACKSEKPADAFPRSARRPGGRHSYCSECKGQMFRDRWASMSLEERHDRALRQRYGISREMLQALWESQEGCCAICGSAGPAPYSADGESQAGRLCIDHDHATGVIRGLLRRNCNSAIGKLGDSPKLIVKAAAYLIERGGK